MLRRLSHVEPLRFAGARLSVLQPIPQQSQRLRCVRIGTWNLAGRWSDDHRNFLERLGCDVLLLTEVNERVDLVGYNGHLTASSMAAKRRWAGIFSKMHLDPLPDPHPASAMAVVRRRTFCSSILPWRSCSSRDPWSGTGHAEKTHRTVSALVSALPRTDLVWGGDWNHAFDGPEYAGSRGGRKHLTTALEDLGLKVPTADLRHRIDGLLSIDHIAVGESTRIESREHHAATAGGSRLSDHDAYVVALSPGDEVRS